VTVPSSASRVTIALVAEKLAVFTMAHCAATDDEARVNAEDGVMNYQRDHVELLCQMLQDDAAPKQSYEYYERFLGVDYDKFTFDYLDSRDMIVVGDPERCIKMAKHYEAIGVDRLLCFMQGFVDRTVEEIGQVEFVSDNCRIVRDSA
jgi:alkanesulfonate monooxygenase SsuD/methylene tetrahydromethanopterin reductase-like flavin-dependent oxidoreductase (luciferase family)